MRKEFIQDVDLETAENIAPWACEVIEVDGGFMCFESPDDAEEWMEQV